MPPIDRLAAQLRRRIAVGEFLRLAGRWMAIFLLLFGLVVLGVKLFAPDYWPRVLWLGCLLPLLGVWLTRRALRLAPSGSELIGLLDDRLAAGGLLMTLSERPDPRWADALPRLDSSSRALPAVIPEPFARMIVVPLMFAAGALALPSRDAPPPPPRDTLASDVSDELEMALGVLRNSDSVDPATAAVLAREIGQLATTIEGGPLTNESWETVDALRGRMRSALDSTDQSLSQGELAVSALINGLAQNDSLPPEEMDQFSQELEQALTLLESSGALEKISNRLPEEFAAGGQLSNADQAVRQIMQDPATREFALSAIGALLSQERDELGRTRDHLARVLEDPGLATTDSSLESVPPPQSVPAARELTGTARELGGTIASLQEILLPTDIVAPFVADGESSPEKPASDEPHAPMEANGDDPPRITNAPPTTHRIDSNIPTDTFSQSATWKRKLRPRHRDVVRRYFHDG